LKPFYTADEVRAFRSLGLEAGIIPAFIALSNSNFSGGIHLLGFKDHSELLFEDNIRHSTFIYPDEDVSNA
jgi:ATP-dependent DNA helicase 2 subunit 1